MNTNFALTSWTVVGMLIGNLAVMADRSQRETEHQPVANEVANEVANGVVAKNTTTDEMVTNTVPNIVTETEVYKVVCVDSADTFCKEYSVTRITKE